MRKSQEPFLMENDTLLVFADPQRAFYGREGGDLHSQGACMFEYMPTYTHGTDFHLMLPLSHLLRV